MTFSRFFLDFDKSIHDLSFSDYFTLSELSLGLFTTQAYSILGKEMGFADIVGITR